MISKKWVAAAAGAFTLTSLAGASALALQDGGNGGGGGGGGRGGDFEDEVSSRAGNATVRAGTSCDDNDATDNSEAHNSCRGFGASGGAARTTARTGSGGEGGNGGHGARGGNRVSIRRAGGGFPF